MTARQLQRSRQAGLIPSTRVDHLGRGKGTATAYPEGTLEQVLAVAALFKIDRSINRVALRLFGAGRWVADARVRTAYAAVLSGLEAEARRWLRVLLRERRDDRNARELVASLARTRTVRAWRRRRDGDEAGAFLRSVLTNLSAITASGEPSSEPGFAEMVRALNTDSLFAEIDPDTRELAFAAAALSKLRAIARRTPVKDLRWGIDALKLQTEFWSSLERLHERTRGALDLGENLQLPVWGLAAARLELDDGLALALFVLVAFAVRSDQRSRHQLQMAVDEYREGLPRVNAFLQLLDALESDDWRYLGMGGAIRLAQAPRAERERWIRRIRQWCADHPDDAALLGVAGDLGEVTGTGT